MRPLFPVSICAVLALVALSACTTTTGVDRLAATSETLDPSQVRMLPDNPYLAVKPADTEVADKR